MSTDMKWYGEQVTAALFSAGVQGINKAAERLRALSVPRTPKRDGPLRRSAGVQPARPTDPSPVAYVTFNTPYARRQHEELTWRHKEGEAKFLERPLREKETELRAIVAAEIRRATRG